MDQREFRFYLNEAENPEDEDDEEEEGEDEEDGGDEQIEVDSPDENADGNGMDNDNGHVDDASEDGSVLDTPPHRLQFTDPEELENEEDDEDAMTWESLSTISEQDQQPDADEWYPLMERKTMFPNFALPTTT